MEYVGAIALGALFGLTVSGLVLSLSGLLPTNLIKPRKKNHDQTH
jgi:hypothetical protein